MKKRLSILLFLFVSLVSFSQRTSPLSKPSDSLNPIAFINTVQQSLNLFYSDYANQSVYDSIIAALKYEPADLPTFSDDVYCQRLEDMSEHSPFHMDCNPTTLATLKFFVAQRRGFTRIVLGRSKLYFEMFEEKLAEYGLPLELRYLAVIESGLRPQVKSKAGALGLWQFMYKTGLYYGLVEDSYIDERMDPDKATDAACRFLKKLYGIYGDWNLSLAAYNAGPGNVNKAIVRSGNKKTYWEVRPYLPTETQGYVPNFIAAAYMLTYHAEHNIIPMDAKIHNAQLDSMCVKQGVHMETIANVVDWDLNEIKELNPIYKSSFIPKSEKGRCVTGPLEKINLLVGLEDSLYKVENDKYHRINTPNIVTPFAIDSVITKDSSVVDTINANYQYYKVKAGDNIKIIAQKYGVEIEKLLEWNGLRTTNIYIGQRLTIKAKPKPVVQPKPPVKPTVPVKKYYTVKKGETFSKIAQKHNLSSAQLKKLNPGININTIHVGQRLRVK
jgi:membrane-bound lytic murein transglycosylase D